MNHPRGARREWWRWLATAGVLLFVLALLFLFFLAALIDDRWANP